MSELRLSAAWWCLSRKGVEAEGVFARLAAAGYAAVEMAEEGDWAAARSVGLGLLNIAGPGMTEGMNDAEHCEVVIPQLLEKIELAAANGIPQVIVFSGNRRVIGGARGERGDEQGRRQLVAALRLVAPVAEIKGVTLLLELLNSHEHANYQCDSAGYAFATVRDVGSTHVKVLFDIYHSHRMGEDPLPLILENLAAIGHLHVAGSPGRDAPSALSDEQRIDYGKILPAVLGAGYGGHVGVEFCGGDDVVEQYERAAGLLRGYAG